MQTKIFDPLEQRNCPQDTSSCKDLHGGKYPPSLQPRLLWAVKPRQLENCGTQFSNKMLDWMPLQHFTMALQSSKSRRIIPCYSLATFDTKKSILGTTSFTRLSSIFLWYFNRYLSSFMLKISAMLTWKPHSTSHADGWAPVSGCQCAGGDREQPAGLRPRKPEDKENLWVFKSSWILTKVVNDWLNTL